MDSRAKKCLLCLTLLAALCGSLPAALAQPAAPAARTERIERVTIADERGDHGLPSPFTHAPDGVGYALTMLVFDSLLWRDRQGHLVPALARQWRESEDRLAVEFELHPQARWHDGQPVTAGDVAFTFDYFRQHPNPFMDVSAVAGVDALAGGRVRVRLKRPSASFVPQLAATLPILPRHVFAPLADPRRMSMQGVVGSGPYRVTGYDKAGGRYRFSAVEGHWQGAPRVRELVFVSMEPSLALGALRRGEVDMIRALPTHLLDEAGRFATVVKAQSGHPARLRFNHARAPFADRRGSRTLTAPPKAPVPYSTEAGPFTTSTRSASPSDMNEATAPAGCAELSRMPSTSSTTLSRLRPRITGFMPCAPSSETASPGSPRTASPTLRACLRDKSSRVSTVVAMGVSAASAA